MLTQDERETLYRQVAAITGTCQDGRYRHEIVASNVEARLRECRVKSLAAYLSYIERNPAEYSEFVSAITIHTTNWFREFPHFEKLEADLREELGASVRKQIRILSVACSLGHEVYSLAMLLETLRAEFPLFDYSIEGIDIDPKSISTANQAVYPFPELPSIPKRFHRHLLVGSGRTAGLFTLSREIRNRCRFSVHSIQNLQVLPRRAYDYVICRNVLIYFSASEVERIIHQLIRLPHQKGKVILGHSEAIDASKFDLRSLGNAWYRSNAGITLADGKTKPECSVLIVDDCQITRRILAKQLETSGIHSESVSSAQEASEFLKQKSVDLITLDLGMPGMDGATWLKSQRLHGMRIPVIIVTGAQGVGCLDVLGALDGGAQDYIDKAALSRHDLVPRVLSLVQTYRRRGNAKTDKGQGVRVSMPQYRPEVILIGASTGGTEALGKLLRIIPPNSPPIVVVQHISADFAGPFASRLADLAHLQWKEPMSGETLQPGCLYMSSGDYHVGVKQTPQGYILVRSATDPVNRHRPSVDFLFRSACVGSRSKIFAILLTGMGDDGAHGLLELKQRGAWTMCQDEDSCVVFGMPKEAIRLGAAMMVGNLQEIRALLDETALRSGRILAGAQAHAS